MAERIQNMTTGSPVKLIFSFALPLMLGNVFQQLYTMVDTMVVGNVLGLKALAALGSGDALHWMVLSVVQGMTQGLCIQLAQDFGSGDMKKLRRTYSTALWLAVISAVVITAVALGALVPVLRVMGTPEEILPTAVSYLAVVFAAVPVLLAYNFLASVLRALGDSKTPLRAMVAASITNIVLDLLFVMVFRWGVIGAAVATVIGQAISVLICLRAVRGLSVLRLEKGELRMHTDLVGRLLKLATPFAFQNLIIALGSLVIQYVINGFGVLYIAGFTATNKLYGLLEIAAYSYGFAMTTYTGQNLGAGKLERIHKGTHAGAVMGMLTAGVISVCMFVFGRLIVGSFISGDPAEAAATIEIAYHYLCIMAAFLPVLYILYVYRSALQGLGDTVMPMISGFAELAARLATILFLPLLIGEEGLFWGESNAWIAADLVLVTSYYLRMHRLKKGEIYGKQ